MTTNGDRRFPAMLAAAMAVRVECIGEDGVEFEPYESFLSADETTRWFRAWTRNGELNGDDFRVFGQDGTGGIAALWLARPVRGLVDQPVDFLGSEGETGVVARDLAAIAEQFAPDRRASAAAIITRATRELPDFDDTIMRLCR